MIAAGQQLIVFGKPKERAGKLYIDHPEFEIVEGEELSIHVNRITPIYRLTEGITQRVLRAAIYRALEELDPPPSTTACPRDLDPPRSPSRSARYTSPIPRPSARPPAAIWSWRILCMQLFVGAKRSESVSRPGRNHAGPGALMDRLHATLPFPLTGAQTTRAIAEIRADLAALRPMNRLLHGDVGSGKTLVALSAMLPVRRVRLPGRPDGATQILAEQPLPQLQALARPLGLNIALRTGSKRAESAEPLFDHAGGKRSGFSARSENRSSEHTPCSTRARAHQPRARRSSMSSTNSASSSAPGSSTRPPPPMSSS